MFVITQGFLGVTLTTQGYAGGAAPANALNFADPDLASLIIIT